MEQTNTPLISVIVPVYNADEYLPYCIESILNQTYTNLEIILVDDGSTDKAGEICDTYALKDKRCKVIHQINQGISGARNTGLTLAKGAYIAFVDCDDCIHPRCYEILYNTINKGDYLCSIACVKKVPSLHLNHYHSESYNTNIVSQETLLKALYAQYNIYESRFYMAVWGKLYKRELLEEEFFKSISAEDVEFNTRIYLKLDVAIGIDIPLYYWLQRPTSVSHKRFNQYHVNMINGFLECLNDIPMTYSKYRGFCLEKLYRTFLSSRYNTDSSLKSKTLSAIKNAKKSTISEFIRNSSIPIISKMNILLFYHIPPLYSLFRWSVERYISIQKKRTL